MTSSTRPRSERKHRQQQIVSFWKDTAGVPPVAFVLSIVVLIGGLFLGGGAGWLGDTAIQLLSLPLIVLAAAEWTRNRLELTDWAALALIGLIGVLALVQLMPLSPAVWAALPARADILASMRDAGASPAWYSISLNPLATERALLWTLPAISMLLAVRWMSDRQRRVLLMVLFCCAVMLIMLGVLQHNASPYDALNAANQAMTKSNLDLAASNIAGNPAANTAAAPIPQSGFGFYSNHNHFAALLAMTMPLVVAFGSWNWCKRSDQKSGVWMSLTFGAALVAFGLLVGMIQTHSRAALALGPIALLGSLLLLRGVGIPRRAWWSIAALTLATVGIAIQLAGSQTVSRLDTSADADVRWKIHATTLEAAHHFGALGTGLGTFVQAYQQVPPVEGVLSAYINHAHSDYHELWLETGVPGMAIVLCFLLWFGWSTWRAWRSSSTSVSASLISRAASLSILLVLLHSYLDYPLRKTAILVVFGMACALLAPRQTESMRTSVRRSAPGQAPSTPGAMGA